VDKVTIDGKEYVVTKSGKLFPTPLPRMSCPDSPRKDTDDDDRMNPYVVNPAFFPAADPVE
jgi:hypothetical protein